MIGIDTNVLVRYVVMDDVKQHQAALKFLQSRSADDQAFVSSIVVAELLWVLRNRYKYSSGQILALLSAMLDTVELHFEDEEFLALLIKDETGLVADIPDYMISHSARKNGCEFTYTLDQRAARDVAGMELLS